MRRIQRDQRREALAPVGDITKKFRIRDFVGIEHLRVGAYRPRIGERQTGLKSDPGRGIVQRENLQRIILFRDDQAGTRIIQRAASRQETFQPVGWKARKP